MEDRQCSKINHYKTRRKTNLGGQKLRWLDNVEADLRTLGVRRWRSKAMDIKEWTATIRVAKVKREGP
ncbi:hypothetical protein C0J52_01584 [Blattella germanica]|nr:hypothetical protein C0J52_01584 [Blattella germanica]